MYTSTSKCATYAELSTEKTLLFRRMANTRRSAVAGEFTHARDPQHMNARALPHALTKCPPQVSGDERGEARTHYQHALQQHFIHPEADRLPHFLNNMLLMIPVKISDNNRNGITTADGASAGSRAQSDSSQPALSTALSACSMHVCFTKQHRDECPSSASRSARITDRGMRSSAPSARARSSARSLSRSFIPCHCGMYVSYVCLSLWYVMSHAYLLRECHGRKTRVQ